MWARALGQEKPWGREWQPPPVFLPGKSQDRGARRALAHEAAKSRSRLSTDEYTHTHTRARTHTHRGATHRHTRATVLSDIRKCARSTHSRSGCRVQTARRWARVDAGWGRGRCSAERWGKRAAAVLLVGETWLDSGSTLR